MKKGLLFGERQLCLEQKPAEDREAASTSAGLESTPWISEVKFCLRQSFGDSCRACGIFVTKAVRILSRDVTSTGRAHTKH